MQTAKKNKASFLSLTMNLWRGLVCWNAMHTIRNFSRYTLRNTSLISCRSSLLPAFKAPRRQNFWWFARGGGGGGGGNGMFPEEPDTLDVSHDRKPIEPLLNEFPVSVSSIRGCRPRMQDEFVVTHDFAAVFDGHGGEAVSLYLRQNLYAYMQAELPTVMMMKSSADPNSMQDIAPVGSRNNRTDPPSLDDYTRAMRSAYHHVDQSVHRISHWSFQGSCVSAVWIHDNKSERHFITSNIGDCRAVLSRNSSAVDLSRDHKPNDPYEKARIESVGGVVIWDGIRERNGEPVPGTGVYRVNGRLSLSRAIGDRAERPAVSADPEITIITMTQDDEFVVVATDGLWDVLSSADVVALVHSLMESDGVEGDQIVQLLVEEALRRGSNDNITVIIIWLKPLMNQHGLSDPIATAPNGS